VRAVSPALLKALKESGRSDIKHRIAGPGGEVAQGTGKV